MLLRQATATALILMLVAACTTPAAQSIPTEPHSSSTPLRVDATGPASATELTKDEIATLSSLERVDDYPLYTMRYQGAYEGAALATGVAERVPDPTAPSFVTPWACSLFAALANPAGMLYGRNFDWEYSPALLLFTDPPDGYASVSMVDIAFLEYDGAKAMTLSELPLVERRRLLSTPHWPFDGMNERGLVVGMAAVPPGNVQPDPNKETIGSLSVIRELLDHAKDVDEAVAIMGSYNVDMRGGPPIHYLIADASGRAALVEFYQGEMVVISNDVPWHQATNFLRAAAGKSAAGQCWRHDTIHERLTAAEGQLTQQDAMDLLADVSQDVTQWSIVYEISTGDVSVTLGRQYDTVHTFRIDPTRP